MKIYGGSAEIDDEARALIARHAPDRDPDAMMTTGQMWTVLTAASPAARDYLLGRWSDSGRCFLMDHDGRLERLRACVERVEALADAWNETPDHAPSDYDRGRVDQRHDMTADLLAALDAGVSS